MATTRAPGNGQAFNHLQLVRPNHKCFFSVVDPYLLNPDPAFQVNPDPDLIRILNDKKCFKKYKWKYFLFLFLIKNCNPQASIKDVQNTGEAFSPQKRTSRTSKYEIYSLLSIFVGYFCPPGSGSGLRIRTRIRGPHWIRIHNTFYPCEVQNRVPCIQDFGPYWFFPLQIIQVWYFFIKKKLKLELRLFKIFQASGSS